MRLKEVIILKICIFEYFGFFYIFLEFTFDFSLMKIAKKGFIYRKTVELTWHGKLTWCAEPPRMRHGKQGHVAEPREPTRGLGGVDKWQGPREPTLVPRWRHVVEWGMAFGGPTG